MMHKGLMREKQCNLSHLTGTEDNVGNKTDKVAPSSLDPTEKAWLQLVASSTEKMTKTLGVDAKVTSIRRLKPHDIQTDPALPKEVTLLSEKIGLNTQTELREELGQKLQSEGYETMTQYSSDIVSEIFYGRSKVMEWLEKNPDMNTEPETWDTAAVALHEMMEANHIVPVKRFISPQTTFAVSEMSGSIGISPLEAKPSLSVICPGTGKSVHVLSRNEGYTSTLFLSISDEEYLATASRNRIHIWSLAKNITGEAYEFEETGIWHLCVIDERTMACVGQEPCPNGITKVYILNTDSEKFSLSSTLRVKAGRGITDICFVKTTDGTACLLLSFPVDNFIQSVEMVGGKVRWQKAGSLRPWSICTDGSTIFVVDPAMNTLRLLSVEDGSSVTSISLYPFGIDLPSCIRLQGDYLVVGHMNKKGDTYCISKFTKKFGD